MGTAAFISVILSLIGQSLSFPLTYMTYQTLRAKLIESDRAMRLGSEVKLDGLETVLNQFILQEKRKAMEESRKNGTLYVPALSFFRSKAWMESTPLFQIIKAMPKGAALHLHDPAITSPEWVVKNLTYRDNVYMCVDQDNFIQLGAFKTPIPNPGCEWKLIKDERGACQDVDAFDLKIKNSISMLSSDPLVEYPSVNTVWRRFDKFFDQVRYLLSSVEIRRAHYRRALEEIRDDNVQYIEVRSGLDGYRDENDVKQDAEFGLNLYKNITDQFVEEYPDDFSGAKFILSANRRKTVDVILEEVKTAMDLRQKYPNFLVGFDLVSQEDPNYSLFYYKDALLYPSQQDPPVYLPYFFHAAETNWQGTEVDLNLVDALLLNASRVGHGFGLIKHPGLIEYFKAKDVAVEINPISNQILGLVNDLRNHVAAPLMAQNVPIVISSDDPATWEADPLSHDFFVGFMDCTGEDSGLAELKQLATNSIKYSAMSESEKSEALELFSVKWQTFVRNMISKFQLGSLNG